MTRDVDFQKYANYLTKAENSLELAKIAIDKQAYDSAVMNVFTAQLMHWML